MKLLGHYNEHGYPAINARIECAQPKIRGFIEFALDSGSPFSILGQVDAGIRKVNYKWLSRHDEPITIAAFTGKPYVLFDVRFYFRDFGYARTLERIYVLPPPEETGNRIIPMPSILGHDFLDSYTFILEKGRGRIILTDEDILKDC